MMCQYFENHNGLKMCHLNYCRDVFNDNVQCPIKRKLARRKDGRKMFPDE